MCLDKVTGLPAEKRGFGYVVRTREMTSLFCNTEEQYTLMAYCKAKLCIVWAEGRVYASGFHVFSKYEDACAFRCRDQIVVPVAYVDAMYEGTQAGFPVVVAYTIVHLDEDYEGECPDCREPATYFCISGYGSVYAVCAKHGTSIRREICLLDDTMRG